MGNILLVGWNAVRRDGHDLAPGLRPGVHVRTVLDQHANRVRMPLGSRPHERGLTARGGGVRIGTGGE